MTSAKFGNVGNKTVSFQIHVKSLEKQGTDSWLPVWSFVN